MSENESTVERPTEPESGGDDGPVGESVVLRIDAGTRSGRAVDASGLADPAAVAAAVAADDRASGGDDRSGDGDGRSGNGNDRSGNGGDRPDVAVDCAYPRPVHDHVGFVRPDMTLRVRTALAAAARSRGETTAHDAELERVRDRLDGLSVPESGETAAARRRLAGTESAVAERRERVAALRGRIQAGRDAGRDVSELRSELAEATRELSEHETERAAAEEALARAERRAREARDARERRRRLQDRAANLERAARKELVTAYRGEYLAAVGRVPGGPADGTAPGEPADGTAAGEPADGTVACDTASESGAGLDPGGDDPFDVDPVTAALAVARVADLRAPVVLACGRFDSPAAAADWLDAPVIRA